MKIKIGNLWYFVLIGLISGFLVGLLVITYENTQLNKIAVFIYCVSMGLGMGVFLGLLNSAGTNFRRGLKAALYGSLFWFSFAVLTIGNVSFVQSIMFGFIGFAFGFISLSLTAVLWIGARRTKICQKFNKWLNNKEAK